MAAPGDACDPAMMELFRAELDTHLPVLAEGLFGPQPVSPELRPRRLRCDRDHRWSG